MDFQAQNIIIKNIIISNRQRTDLGDISGLALSIERIGLQYPIIVQPTEGEQYILIAGERRVRAYQRLERPTIPAYFKEQLDPDTREELELEENLQRKQFNYIEEAKAIAKLDRIKRERYGSAVPGRFSRGTGWGRKDTANALGISEGKVSEDIQLADACALFPHIERYTTRREALREVRRLCRGGDQVDTPKLKYEECFSLGSYLSLETIEADTVSLLFLDLSEGNNYTYILTQSHRLLNYVSNAFLFFSLPSLPLLKERLKELKFSFQDKPFMWHIKTKDDYIPFLWFSKGLIQPPNGISKHLSYAPSEGLHSLSKPYQLYFNLITSASKKGDFILEVNAYGIDCTKAALDLGRNIKSICFEKVLHEQVLLNLKG